MTRPVAGPLPALSQVAEEEQKGHRKQIAGQHRPQIPATSSHTELLRRSSIVVAVPVKLHAAPRFLIPDGGQIGGARRGMSSSTLLRQGVENQRGETLPAKPGLIQYSMALKGLPERWILP